MTRVAMMIGATHAVTTAVMIVTAATTVTAAMTATSAAATLVTMTVVTTAIAATTAVTTAVMIAVMTAVRTATMMMAATGGRQEALAGLVAERTLQLRARLGPAAARITTMVATGVGLVVAEMMTGHVVEVARMIGVQEAIAAAMLADRMPGVAVTVVVVIVATALVTAVVVIVLIVVTGEEATATVAIGAAVIVEVTATVAIVEVTVTVVVTAMTAMAVAEAGVAMVETTGAVVVATCAVATPVTGMMTTTGRLPKAEEKEATKTVENEVVAGLLLPQLKSHPAELLQRKHQNQSPRQQTMMTVEAGAPPWLARRRRAGRKQPRPLPQMTTAVVGKRLGHVVLAVVAVTRTGAAEEIVTATAVVGRAAEAATVLAGRHPPGGRPEHCSLGGELGHEKGKSRVSSMEAVTVSKADAITMAVEGIRLYLSGTVAQTAP